jgi:YbgC/YbaW family acyl-CoA thioester hydrolase
MAMTKISGSRFESVIPLRPSDIDGNQHVHNTVYLEYVLAARYDQMKRCYKMPMDEFIEKNWGWWVRKTYIEYKRSLKLGDTARVRTWVEEYDKSRVMVHFEIYENTGNWISAAGYLEYVFINLANNKPTHIPPEVIERYSV